MGEDAGLFQVIVGEVSPWVVIGNDVRLDIQKECGSPESQRMSQSKEDTPHAWLGSVNQANHRWIVWYHLHKSGWADGDVPGEGLKVGEVIVKETGDLDLVLVQMGKSQLQGTKEACRTQDCWAHEPELSQHMLPFLHTYLVVALQTFEGVHDPLRASLHQFQCHVLTI